MENAVLQLEAALIEAEQKINNIEWKLSEFETGVVQSMLRSGPKISVLRITKDIENVEETCESLKSEMSLVQKFQNDTVSSLQEQLNALQNETKEFRDQLRNRNQRLK